MNGQIAYHNFLYYTINIPSYYYANVFTDDHMNFFTSLCPIHSSTETGGQICMYSEPHLKEPLKHFRSVQRIKCNFEKS